MTSFRGFLSFIRRRGVVGLAIGFIFGISIQRVVTSFVDGLINPLVGLLLADFPDLRSASFHIGDTAFQWGSFAVTLLDFVILAFVVYLVFKVFRLDRLSASDE